MTNEELATIKTSMATELTECVGDHIKLMAMILRLQDEAAELRHTGPGPYVRPEVPPAGGQDAAERPGYVLKDDPAAPAGLPVAGAKVTPPPSKLPHGQDLAEQPGYVLKEDKAAPKDLPIAGAKEGAAFDRAFEKADPTTPEARNKARNKGATE